MKGDNCLVCYKLVLKMSLPTASTQNVVVSLSELYAQHRRLEELIHERENAEMKENLSRTDGVKCTAVKTDGCGVYFGQRISESGSVSQGMYIDFECGSGSPFKISVDLEYIDGYAAGDTYLFTISVVAPDGTEKTFVDDPDDTCGYPWFGHEEGDPGEFEGGLVKVLKRLEKRFGPGEHYEAAKACVVMLNKNNEVLRFAC